MTDKVINLFTHTDQDGVGCSVLAHQLAKESDSAITVAYCDYSNIDERVNHLLDVMEIAAETIDEKPKLRQILITDISVNKDTMERLSSLMEQDETVFVSLIDHHQPKEHIENCYWAYINTDPRECGTSLLHKLIALPDSWLSKRAVSQFVDDVRLYDTWQFDKDNPGNPMDLNVLMSVVGKDNFLDIVDGWFSSEENFDRPFVVAETDWYMLVENDMKQRKEYCALHNRRMKKASINGYTVGIVFAERYISQVGDYILEQNPDIDFCAIVNFPVSVSLRTRRDDINLGKDVAAVLGGGGHPKAAGYSLTNSIYDGEFFKSLADLDIWEEQYE